MTGDSTVILTGSTWLRADGGSLEKSDNEIKREVDSDCVKTGVCAVNKGSGGWVDDIFSTSVVIAVPVTGLIDFSWFIKSVGDNSGEVAIWDNFGASLEGLDMRILECC